MTMKLASEATFCRAFLAAGLLAAATAHARAQDWTGQVTLYGWGAGVTGDFRPFDGAPELSFSRSLSEVLEDLDAAVFLTGLARRGDLVLLGDLTYSALSREGATPVGPASGEVTIRSLSLAVGKRFQLRDGSNVDVLGGIRSWSLDGQVAAPAVGVSVAPRSDFTDPILALRGTTSLSDRWSVLGYVDVGGFGVGSEFTWQAALIANYRTTDNLYFSVGWRHLYLDYSDGGTEFEGTMTGPVLGATWSF
jgi:hypothetical protein